MGCQPCGGRSQVLGGKEKGWEQRVLDPSGGESLCWQGSSSSFLHVFSQHDWKTTIKNIIAYHYVMVIGSLFMSLSCIILHFYVGFDSCPLESKIWTSITYFY